MAKKTTQPAKAAPAAAPAAEAEAATAVAEPTPAKGQVNIAFEEPASEPDFAQVEAEVEAQETETAPETAPEEAANETEPETTPEGEGEPEAEAESETETETEPEAETTEAEAAPAEDIVEEVDDGEPETEAKPDKLSKYRKGKVIDEEAVAAELDAKAQLEQQLGTVVEVMKRSPEARAAYWKAVKAAGGELTEAAEAELAEFEKKATPAPQAKQEAGSDDLSALTRDDAEKRFKAIYAKDGEFAAQEFVAEWKAAKAKSKLAQEIAPLKQRQEEDEKRRATEAENAARQARNNEIAKQLKVVAKKFPSAIKVHPDGKIEYVDKKLWDGVRKANADGKFGAGATMIECVRYVLTQQGRLRKKAKAAAPAAAATAGKPKMAVPGKSTARVTEIQPKAKSGEIQVRMDGN